MGELCTVCFFSVCVFAVDEGGGIAAALRHAPPRVSVYENAYSIVCV